MSDSPRIAFLASSAPDAQQALQLLSARHGQHAPEEVMKSALAAECGGRQE